MEREPASLLPCLACISAYLGAEFSKTKTCKNWNLICHIWKHKTKFKTDGKAQDTKHRYCITYEFKDYWLSMPIVAANHYISLMNKPKLDSKPLPNEL